MQLSVDKRENTPKRNSKKCKITQNTKRKKETVKEIVIRKKQKSNNNQ